MQSASAGIRSKIFRAVFDEISRGKNSWKTFVFNANPRIGFVVAQQNIVTRLQIFNQVVFQQKRIGFGCHHNVLYGYNFAHQNV